MGAVISLLDEGATVPFISRYRKERTGSLDEVAVRAVETALEAVRELEKRREFVLGAVAEAGALTPELKARIEEADTSTDLEDLYAPYKPKRRTRASIAREKGFEPLAKRIMAGRMARIDASEEAVEGACDIIAEWYRKHPACAIWCAGRSAATALWKRRRRKTVRKSWKHLLMPSTPVSAASCVAAVRTSIWPCAAPRLKVFLN